MSESSSKTKSFPVVAIIVSAAIAFLYAPLLMKLGRDWWSDENYSHGLLVPFVIAFIIWNQRELLVSAITKPNMMPVWVGIAIAALMLLAGTLGAELFTQRVSLALMLATVVVYFFGRKVLKRLAVPFALLALAIPIPQIVFNRIALPLQMWASQMAVWGIRLFEVPTVRKGNVIDILPKGGVQPISLEVVEACSGIRSLMTLIAIALVLGYFTRSRDGGGFANLTRSDLVRTVILMIAAVPIAVLTNAARVTATGVMTYEYGKQATETTVHDASGWVVYVVALVLLIGVNFGLKSVLARRDTETRSLGFDERTIVGDTPGNSFQHALPLVIVLVLAGLGVNWFANRAEVVPSREPLAKLGTQLGNWRQRGDEFRFDKSVEDVLRATDYTMREYVSSEGRVANVYVGYYSTQRTGATYHSPQNCLPGAGWVMSEPEVVTVTTPQGQTFSANRYLLENGVYHEVMLYWYQGRGRIEPSEFRDKLNTVVDSVTRRRTDGAMIRVMTDVGGDEPSAQASVADLAAQLEDQLPPFIPE
ncbi:MAG: EpsI family protein [Acidobacteria bacterium]|nr:EpsI family protein [Acidobacteriota bacterium]